MDSLLTYRYPGNVRELQNLIERGVICADNDTLVDRADLFRGSEKEALAPSLVFDAVGGRLSALAAHAVPAEFPGPDTPRETAIDPVDALIGAGVSLDDVERMLCERVLSESDGNLSAAARRLHISRAKLEHRAKQWGLLRVRPHAK